MLKLFLKKKKIQGYMNKWLNVIDRLSEATGISQKCLRNIHTEFLANNRTICGLSLWLGEVTMDTR